MSRLKGFGLRLGTLLRPGLAESRMREEFAFHLEMEISRHLAEGRSPQEARRRALLAFGGVERYHEEMRDGRAAGWLRDAAADLRYAWRVMRRNPGLSAAIALTLGIGIGVSGLTYGVVDNLFVRPIPARAADRLVGIFRSDTTTGGVRNFTVDDLPAVRAENPAFADVAGTMGVPLTLAVERSAPEQIWAEIVTANYFAVLDLIAAHGRTFLPPDVAAADPPAVLSHASWQTRFQSDPSVVGRRLRVNGTTVVIAGVAPKGFRGIRKFGFWPELWLPLDTFRSIEGRGRGSLITFGRLNDGFTLETAQQPAHPQRRFDLVLVPAASGFENPRLVRPHVLALSSILPIIAGVLTLFIISANLANLQLARIETRTRELVIRVSLGCSRHRLVRQLATETFVLALPGALIAAAIIWALPVLETLTLPVLPFRAGMDLAPNLRVAAFATILGLSAIVFIGVMPAVRATRPSPAPRRPSAMRTALVVSQLAMSVVLVIGGLLFTRSLLVARASDRGFDADNRLLVSVNLVGRGYDEARRARFYEDVLAGVRATTEVLHASWVFPAPFDTHNRVIMLFGRRENAGATSHRTELSVVGDDFEGALGLTVVAGRGFAPSDDADAPPVMLVSQTLAARLWPGEDPIGKRAFLGSASGRHVTVTGVIGDARFQPLGESDHSRAYLPLRQHYRDWQTLVVHTRGDARAALPGVRTVVTSIDPALPVFGASTLNEAIASGFVAPRTAAVASNAFALLALLIAAVGLYAVVAANVSERRTEIGIRLALGSTRGQVTRLVMADAARFGVWGLALGCAGGIVLARAIAGLLFGIPPFDPVTFAAAPMALCATVLGATYLPARRAARLDVMAVLRDD